MPSVDTGNFVWRARGLTMCCQKRRRSARRSVECTGYFFCALGVSRLGSGNVLSRKQRRGFKCQQKWRLYLTLYLYYLYIQAHNNTSTLRTCSPCHTASVAAFDRNHCEWNMNLAHKDEIRISICKPWLPCAQSDTSARHNHTKKHRK